MHAHLRHRLLRHLPPGTDPPGWVDDLMGELSEVYGDPGLNHAGDGQPAADPPPAPIEARPDLFLKIDRGGTILECSGPPLALNLPEGAVEGRRLRELPCREVAEPFADALARVDDGGRSVVFTYGISGRDRHLRYQARIVPVLPDLRIVIVRDLTDLITAAGEVEKQRAFLRQIIDLNPSFIFAKDRDGRFTLVNQAVAAAYGTTVDQLVGRTDADFNPDPEQIAHFRRCDLQVMDTRREMLIPEEPITGADGERRWLQTIKRPILSPDGQVSHVLGVATDITQRKLAELELDKRSRRIERQVEAMIELALMKGGDRRVVFRRITELAARTVDVERAAIWLFNDDRSALVCRAVHQRDSRTAVSQEILAADIPAYVAALESSRILAADDAGSDPRTAEFRRRCLEPMGIMSCLDAAILLNGRPAGVIRLEHVGPIRQWSPEEQQFAASLADFVALVMGDALRRHLEEQLRHSQKMEAIGALAGGVAHDFNNLLTGILGYCGMIEHVVRREDPVATYAGEIRRAGARAAALTRQLLAFSRRQILDPRVLNLNAVVGEMEGLLQRMIGERHEIVTALAGSAGSIHADRGQLEQILMNLVVNARDAMDNGGRIRIETSEETLDERQARSRPGLSAGPHICLSVSDTGHGMDEATISRIFEPFFTTKEKGRGTGLGLSTVYGIVQQSKWHIEVASGKGQGTTFRIRMPRAAAVQSQGAAGASTGTVAPARRQGVTVLVVEDEPLVRNLTRDFLQLAGYTVLEAASPGEAILTCETHPGPIALLLSDVMMPQLTGRELFDRVHPRRPEMRVLYMSGYTETAIVKDSVLESGTCFLPKPFTLEGLIAKVEEVLHGAASGRAASNAL